MEQTVRSTTPISNIRKRIVAIFMFSLLGAAVGWGTTAANRDMYTSTALILVSPYSLSVLTYEPASLNLSGDQVVIDTQMQLMRSPQTLDRVAQVLLESGPQTGQALDYPETPALLREYLANNLSIRRVNAAEIVEVSFSANDPELAAFVANEVVTQFLQTQRETKAADLERVGAELELRVAVLAQAAQAADLAVIEARGDQASARDAEKDRLSQAMASLNLGLASLEDAGASADPVATETALEDTRAALSSALSDLAVLVGSDGSTAEPAQDGTGSLATLVREAEVKANVHREMLQRLLEIRELGNFLPDDARQVAAAVPSGTSSSIPPIVIAVMGFLAFAVFGTLVAATAGSVGRPAKDWA